MHTSKRMTIAYLAMAAALLALFALNLFWGSVALSPADIAAALLGRGTNALAANILLQLRLPRAVMVVLLGAALSVAGYLLQTFFANPIAGPFVMGISSGAKLAVALTMVVFLNRGLLTGSLTLILAAFAGAMAAMLFCAGRGAPRAEDEHFGYLRRHDRLHLLGRHRYCRRLRAGFQHRQPAQLVDGQLLRHDLGQCRHGGGHRSALPGRRVFALKPMAAYQLGESYAASVGVPVRAFSVVLVLLSSLLAACVTAFAGPISFVGIAVPHLVKHTLGSAKPLRVLPGCALGGAAFCLLCDLIARSLFAPTELSISSVTAVFGAPVVIWLLVRRHSGEGTV